MINERRRSLMYKTDDNKYTLKQYLTASTKYGNQIFTQGAIAAGTLGDRSGNISIISKDIYSSGDNMYMDNTGLKFYYSTHTTIAASTFQNCTNLEYIIMPNCTVVYTSAANGCTKLKGVDFGGSPTSSYGFIRTTSFSGCSVLKTIILRGSTVWRLDYTAVFTNSPFASGKSGGTLYVPEDLISSYQAANNWSTILGYTNNKILAIEGSIYENNYVDGTPIGGYS